jgi:hypothetical protein
MCPCRPEVIVGTLADSDALGMKTTPGPENRRGSHKQLVCGALGATLQTRQGLYQQVETAASHSALTASHPVEEACLSTHPSGRSIHRSYVP